MSSNLTPESDQKVADALLGEQLVNPCMWNFSEGEKCHDGVNMNGDGDGGKHGGGMGNDYQKVYF